MPTASFELRVNGAIRRVETDPATPLVYVLRNTLGLVGAKVGCSLEQCGSCAVLVDGVSTLSCVRGAAEFAGREIVTIEGLAADPASRPLVDAFVTESAAQCGYCTPGIVVATAALLREDPRPDGARVRAALDRHLCRCGAHPRVLRAVERAMRREGADADER